MAIKVRKTENNGVVYSDPAKPAFTVRFKQTEQNKVLNGAPVVNHATEIIINDSVPFEKGGIKAVDQISVRVRVSGTAHSKAAVKSALSVLNALPQWADEDVFSGFMLSLIHI